MKYWRPLFCVVLLLGTGPVSMSAQVMVSDHDAKPAQKFDPNIDLPESNGRALVLRACTKCHELGGLAAYKDYWRFPQWKAMVEDMVKNGAELQPDERNIVAEYLARHFGPDAK